MRFIIENGHEPTTDYLPKGYKCTKCGLFLTRLSMKVEDCYIKDGVLVHGEVVKCTGKKEGI